MSEMWPPAKSDEIDPGDEKEDEKNREEEIKGDKPPHHGE